MMNKLAGPLYVIFLLLFGLIPKSYGLEVVESALECERILGNVESKKDVYVLMIKENKSEDGYISMCVDTVGGKSRWPTLCMDVTDTNDEIVRSNEWFYLRRSTMKLTMGDSMYQCEVAEDPSAILQKITKMKQKELVDSEP